MTANPVPAGDDPFAIFGREWREVPLGRSEGIPSSDLLAMDEEDLIAMRDTTQRDDCDDPDGFPVRGRHQLLCALKGIEGCRFPRLFSLDDMTAVLCEEIISPDFDPEPHMAFAWRADAKAVVIGNVAPGYGRSEILLQDLALYAVP